MGAEDKLLTLFKQAANGVYESRKPCNVFVGRIESVDPLTASCGRLQNIPQELLTVCSGVSQRLSAGAAVVMMRSEGGQRYIILDTLSGSEGKK